MKTTMTQVTVVNEAVVSNDSDMNLESSFVVSSYHELADVTVVQQDPLEQLNANLQLLEDMQSRLSFLMREIRYQLKF